MTTTTKNYYPARKKLVLLLLVAITFLLGGAGLISAATRMFAERDILLWGEFDIGFVVLVVCAAILIAISLPIVCYLIYQLLMPKPVLTVGPRGFYDSRRMKRPIPLRDISGLNYDPAIPHIVGLYTQTPREFENLWRWLKHRFVGFRLTSPRRFNINLRFVRVSALNLLEDIAETENPELLLAYAQAVYETSELAEDEEHALDPNLEAQLNAILHRAAKTATEPRTIVNVARWYIGDGPMTPQPELTDKLLDGSAELMPDRTLYWVRRFANPSSHIFNPALAIEMNDALRRKKKTALNLPALDSPEMKRLDFLFEHTPRATGKILPLFKQLFLFAIAGESVPMGHGPCSTRRSCGTGSRYSAQSSCWGILGSMKPFARCTGSCAPPEVIHN